MHQQERGFRLLSIITSPEATTQDTEHTILLDIFKFTLIYVPCTSTDAKIHLLF